MANGDIMAVGLAPSLPAVVAITLMWQSGQRLRDVAAAWPLFGSVEMAEARERGDVAEHRWRSLYEDPWQVYPFGALRDFIDMAIHTPRLRALVPLTSGHFTMVMFATTTGAPYGTDGPSVRSWARTDMSAVCAADGRELGVATLPAASRWCWPNWTRWLAAQNRVEHQPLTARRCTLIRQRGRSRVR